MKLFLILISFFLFSCNNDLGNIEKLTEDGVSRELADYRDENISNLTYALHFRLPEKIDEAVIGDVKIVFDNKKNTPLIIDFFAPKENVISVKNNGKVVDFEFKNQHIIIPQNESVSGENNVEISFVSTDISLNRRDEFMYTLLVPDRARTLFPLFDQPSLKAKYLLELTIPESWCAIANSREIEESIDSLGNKNVRFNVTEPISSYLFSFVAGKFKYVTDHHKGREHRIYHRENDEANIKQLDAIFKELYFSLDWLEEYTGIDYPFSKYDMVIIPGFQYGGMEHIGATIYKATSMFLSPTPTMNEKISRAKLIAHETAHMWFGDYITMAWFDDVWTKEVFANYFAAKIITPLFPDLEEKQGMLNYFSAAYSEDRTVGGTSIKQDLDNMRYAGLIYNSIIYNKSPLILNMIVDMLGEDAFRNAVRETLNKYAYSCATWEQWVEIFDAHSEKNITSWSENWMYKNGMPHVTIKANGKVASIKQKDVRGRGLVWGQEISFLAIGKDGQKQEYNVYLDKDSVSSNLDFEPTYIIPNNSGNSYGYFQMDKKSIDWLIGNLSSLSSNIEKRMALINLYDNVLHNSAISTEEFITTMLPNLSQEKDQLIYSNILQTITGVYKTYLEPREGKGIYTKVGKKIEDELWGIFLNSDDKGIKAVTFKSIYSLMISNESAQKIYKYWNKETEVKDITLGIRDYVNMSFNLALFYPEKSKDILEKQLSQIKNPDIKQEFIFVSQALAADSVSRNKFFNSLLEGKNREIESWTSRALSLLVSKREGDYNRNDYIAAALKILPEIQRTGDIFFPQAWCGSLLGGNNSYEAYLEVDKFIKENPDIHPLLKSKLLISADHLYRLYSEK